MIVVSLITALLLAWLLTGAVRRYALARALLDIPNARSSHDSPTPRGGGVAIVVTVLCLLPILVISGSAPISDIHMLVGPSLIVALIGWLDDHGHVPARWRLGVHFAAAAWVLILLGTSPLPDGLMPHRFAVAIAYVVSALYLVWVLNLTNFMDGIDGLAGVHTICVACGGALLYFMHGESDAAVLPLLLACATAGFLAWNFPPARIFLGDAGSGFLGILIGAMSLQAAQVSADLFWSWLILQGVFIVDATVTLLRRLLRGERVYEAHRTHAYQHAARRYGGHLPVTLGVAAIILVWLLPLALWVGTGGLSGPLGVAAAYLPLVALALYYGAGHHR